MKDDVLLNEEDTTIEGKTDEEQGAEEHASDAIV